jgi:hypothetical protein
VPDYSFPFITAKGTKLLNRTLICILPHPQLDFEEVYSSDAERGHQSAIGPTQEQQVRLTFNVVAEG